MIDWGNEYESNESTPLPEKDVATVHVISEGWHEGTPIQRNMMTLVEFVVCPRVHECQMAKEGICACAKTYSSQACCPWADCLTVRTKEHGAEMLDAVRRHPGFERLMPRRSRRFAVIGEDAYVNLGFRPRRDGQLGFLFEDDFNFLGKRRQSLDLGLPIPLHASSGIVPLASLSPSAIETLITTEGFGSLLGYEAHMFRGDYDKMISQLLTDIRRCWPEGYAEFVSEFPRHADIAPDNRGRYAKASTCPDGTTFGSGRLVFTKRGDRLETHGYAGYIHVLGAEIHNAQLCVDITDKLVVTITDESQVDPMATVFV